MQITKLNKVFVTLLPGLLVLMLLSTHFAAAEEIELEIDNNAVYDIAGSWNVVEKYDGFPDYSATWEISRTGETERRIKYQVVGTRPSGTSETGRGKLKKTNNTMLVKHVCYGYPGCGECRYKFKGYATANYMAGSALFYCDDGYEAVGVFWAARTGVSPQDVAAEDNPR